MRTTPTSRSLHEEIASTGSQSRSSKDSRPMNKTPPACPTPQRRPMVHACRRDSTANGATAAKWSGPETTWIAPATKPVRTEIMRLCQSPGSNGRRA